MDTKKVIVTMKPVELTFPEDWTDEQITEHLNSTTPGIWSTWKYEQDWRN